MVDEVDEVYEVYETPLCSKPGGVRYIFVSRLKSLLIKPGPAFLNQTNRYDS